MRHIPALQNRLKSYSAFAGTFLASVSAQAQIVYSDIPDTSIEVGTLHGSASMYLDLNNDGVSDFKITIKNNAYTSSGIIVNYFTEKVDGLYGNQAYNAYSFYEPAIANLGSNVPLGPSVATYVHSYAGYVYSTYQRFKNFGLLRLREYGPKFGFWQSAVGRFMGVRLLIDGQYHYGWVRMDVSNPYPNKITVRDYAYNNNANEPILTGQTTPPACSDNYEPNNTKADAAPIQTGTDVYSQLATAGDHDWFSFTVPADAPNIKMRLYNLPKNYNLILKKGSGQVYWSSTNGSTDDETIIVNNADPGTYYALVRGHNQFDAANCYELKVQTSSTPFKEASAVSESSDNDDLVSLYPNPTSGDQVVLTGLYQNTKYDLLSVFDATGKLLRQIDLSTTANDDVVKVNVKDLVAGIYFVQIHSASCNVVKKLVVSR